MAKEERPIVQLRPGPGGGRGGPHGCFLQPHIPLPFQNKRSWKWNGGMGGIAWRCL